MDSSRDNAFTRFATFWWALGTFLIFGALIALLWVFNHKAPETLEEAAAEVRYKTKEEILKAQATSLPDEAIEKAIDTVGAQLVSSKPTAGSDSKDVVPGSETAKKLAANAPVDPTAINKAAAESKDPVDPAVMEKGKALYAVCLACHGPNGEGMAGAGPPLANSEWVTGPVSNLVTIGYRGIIGPITVNGKEYKDFLIGMMPMAAHLESEDYAALLTYIRNSFGNQAPPVKPEWVEAFKGEKGKPQLPTSELIPPAAK